ncbi:hypothetical protein B0T16DRAFT_12831 [Cercophora newfieldiana]|uniref:Secreted protein n=1 Tax=Cercophora newfieldiana TaxID=92897 RepID=A0AA39YMV2_9PEZI|nr:hypothetical protein B0T16DRAFT_12831 [Cercophora newfieldiana]
MFPVPEGTSTWPQPCTSQRLRSLALFLLACFFQALTAQHSRQSNKTKGVRHANSSRHRPFPKALWGKPLAVCVVRGDVCVLSTREPIISPADDPHALVQK